MPSALVSGIADASLTPIISIRDLHVRYGDLPPAIDGLTLDVMPGECLLITGRSGCGKSTLARALTGLIPHAISADLQGEVTVAGLDINQSTIPELAERIGIVFQNPASQLFHLTVSEEVSFGPYNLGLPPDEIAERVEWVLGAVGLSALRDRKPSELSGGQQQRLAIAAVLSMRPSILVLDEPTASLDPAGARDVMRTLAEMRERFGITLILIEHRLTYGAPLADRLIVMDEGRIAAEGTPEAILGDPTMLARFELRPPSDSFQDDQLALLPLKPAESRPLLSLRGVSAGYGRHLVLEDLTFDLYPGDFAALVGDNGAGKTTLSLVLAGLLKPMRGTLVTEGGGRPRPGEDVTLLFQNPSDQLFTDSVDDEVAFGPRNTGLFDADAHKALLENTGLTPYKTRMPVSLSIGQQQRTTLAACIALRSRLLILDEPTLGQDWGHLLRIMELVAALNAKGTAVVLISHDTDLVWRYARRVIRLEDGRIVEDGRIA